jgi:hypothetical protein
LSLSCIHTQKKKNSGPRERGPGRNEVSFRARPHHNVHSILGVDHTYSLINQLINSHQPHWRQGNLFQLISWNILYRCMNLVHFPQVVYLTREKHLYVWTIAITHQKMKIFTDQKYLQKVKIKKKHKLIFLKFSCKKLNIFYNFKIK